jgi:hypothetical protein
MTVRPGEHSDVTAVAPAIEIHDDGLGVRLHLDVAPGRNVLSAAGVRLEPRQYSATGLLHDADDGVPQDAHTAVGRKPLARSLRLLACRTGITNP